MSRKKNNRYSAELKLQAVQDYLGGNGSLRDACRKYGIKGKKQRWKRKENIPEAKTNKQIIEWIKELYKEQNGILGSR